MKLYIDNLNKVTGHFEIHWESENGLYHNYDIVKPEYKLFNNDKSIDHITYMLAISTFIYVDNQFLEHFESEASHQLTVNGHIYNKPTLHPYFTPTDQPSQIETLNHLSNSEEYDCFDIYHGAWVYHNSHNKANGRTMVLEEISSIDFHCPCGNKWFDFITAIEMTDNEILHCHICGNIYEA